MTLNTRIWIRGKVDATDLFWWVNHNLLEVENPIHKETRTVDCHSIHNALGQGFSAIFELDVYSSPQTYVDDYYESGEAEDDYTESELETALKSYHDDQEKVGKYNAEISFDTGYGYRKNGMTCDALHAYYISKLLTEYLEPKGMTLAWMNEYTGEINENLNGFKEFLNTGKNAHDWFEGVRQLIEGGYYR